MARASVRTHIFLPRELIDELDQVAGAGRRSEFIVSAVAEKLARERRERVFNESAGILAAEEYPEFATGEAISAWVAELRRADAERDDQKLGSGS